MLYLIGGASRSGKSTLARRLLDTRQVPFFCADYLTSGLESGVPGVGVRHEIPDQRRGELVWPVLCGLLRNIGEVEPRYVVEGSSRGDELADPRTPMSLRGGGREAS